MDYSHNNLFVILVLPSWLWRQDFGSHDSFLLLLLFTQEVTETRFPHDMAQMINVQIQTLNRIMNSNEPPVMRK